jgi:DNA-directed RNA polymerase specialized sigma24 family protein
LFDLLLPEMHQIAQRCFRRERSGNSLQPTALVNEAFLRLANSRDVDWQDRGHFLAITARVMRRSLIDHARSRPEVLFLPLEGLPERFLGTRTASELVIEVDELLDDLERESTRGGHWWNSSSSSGQPIRRPRMRWILPCTPCSGSGTGLAAGSSSD